MSILHKIQVDGYTVGDRLLEGVMFNALIEQTGGKYKLKSLVVSERSKSYFNELNTKKWLKEMREYVEGELESEGEMFVEEAPKWDTEE